MNIVERTGCEPLQVLIPRFLSDAKANLLAEDSNGWVVEIAHHVDTDTRQPRRGDWVSMTFSIDVKEEIVLNPIMGTSDDDALLNGLILQSHITSLENILQCLHLDLDTKGWKLVVYEED